VEALRFNDREFGDLHLAADAEIVLDGVRGDCLELALEMEPEGAREFGVKVRCSPDGVEQTAVVYAPEEGALKVDVSRSTLDENIRYTYYRSLSALNRLPESQRRVGAQAAPLELAPGEPLRLRLFLDRSVLEVFANSRQCITQRIYPTRRDSLGVLLFARGGSVRVKSVQAWDLAPTNS
jgi:sucrose-6-phosphate hydrolase SacC (GH32 family)